MSVIDQGNPHPGHWISTGQMDFLILISNFWPLGEGFRGLGPQIRLQHAEIPRVQILRSFGWELKGFPKCLPDCLPVARITVLLGWMDIAFLNVFLLFLS